ncbi:MAG: chloride channel protein, partial [Bacteroidetes bacterium]
MERALKDKILLWRRRFIPQKYFIILLAVFTGFLAGVAAVIIKNTVHFIQYILTHGFAENVHNYLYFIYPLIGLFLNYQVILKLFKGEDVGHGIPNTLYAISKSHGIIKKMAMYASVITSAITVGFGGSVG